MLDHNLSIAVDQAWAEAGGYLNYSALDNELMMVWASYGCLGDGKMSCSVNTGLGGGGD